MCKLCDDDAKYGHEPLISPSELKDELGVCECGCAMAEAENGQIMCSDTLQKFRLIHGVDYGHAN